MRLRGEVRVMTDGAVMKALVTPMARRERRVVRYSMMMMMIG